MKILNLDCLQALPFISDESTNLILTDPPYGINFKSSKQNCNTRNKKPVKVDRPEYFTKVIGDKALQVDWLTHAYRVLKPNSAIYIFCHWSKWHTLFPAVVLAGFKVKNMIVLNKSNHGMGDLKGSYAPKHELMLFAVKGRHHLKKRHKDIWDVPVKFSGSKRYHPNEKPLSWIEPCILNSSEPNDLILDPFAGSGSTGVAAKKLGRDCILIEADANYYQICQNRLENEDDKNSDERSC